MKKSLLSILTLTLLSTAFAEWSIPFFIAGQFYENDAQQTLIEKELEFALVVDMKNKGFESFQLQAGDTIQKGEFLNDSQEYKTLVVSKLDSTVDYTANADSSWKFDNTSYGFSGNEEFALIVWEHNDTLNLSAGEMSQILAGDTYMVINPRIAQTGDEDWKVPVSNTGVYDQWYILSSSYDPEFGISDSFFVLSQAVPEPSTYATLFGLFAMGYVITSRKRK